MNEDTIDFIYSWFDTLGLIDTVFRPMGIFKMVGQEDDTPLRDVFQQDIINFAAYLVDAGEATYDSELDTLITCLDDSYTEESVKEAIEKKAWLNKFGQLQIPNIVRYIVGLDNEMHDRDNATEEPQGPKIAGIFSILGGILTDPEGQNSEKPPKCKEYIENTKNFVFRTLFIFRE